MRLTERRIKQIIQEELDLFMETKIAIKEEEAEIDLSAVQGDAEKAAQVFNKETEDMLLDFADKVADKNQQPEMVTAIKALIQQLAAQKTEE